MLDQKYLATPTLKDAWPKIFTKKKIYIYIFFYWSRHWSGHGPTRPTGCSAPAVASIRMLTRSRSSFKPHLKPRTCADSVCQALSLNSVRAWERGYVVSCGVYNSINVSILIMCIILIMWCVLLDHMVSVQICDVYGFDHVMHGWIMWCVLLDHVSESYDVCKNKFIPTLQWSIAGYSIEFAH